MISLNCDLLEFKETILFKKPAIIRQAFSPSTKNIEEFYRILLNPVAGAHGSGDFHHSLIKILHQTQPVDPNVWSHRFSGDAGYYRDINALKKAIQLKCSVVFDQYYRYSIQAKQLVAFIQEFFNCKSGCNAYLSQKDGAAFPVHCDAHHVLVFSLHGAKRWKVYNTIQEMYQAYNDLDAPYSREDIENSGLLINEILYPGDILYIPIGQFHAVENLENNSLHWAISMSYKPLYTMLDDVLLTILSSSSPLDFSDKVKEILNEVHPFCLANHPLSLGDMRIAANKFKTLFDEIFQDENFLKMQNQPDRNKHLDMLVEPSQELIQELIECSK